MIGIIARSESTELVGALRRYLPDIAPAALRDRLRSGAILFEIDPFNVSDEPADVRAQLLGVVAVLKAHGATYEIHEFGAVQPRPCVETRIEEATLRNILDEFVGSYE
jgi:hypothetical protein